MGIKEVSASFEFKCDRCSAVEAKQTASLPYCWSNMVLHRDAYDSHNAAVADAVITRVFCADCTSGLSDILNDWSAQPEGEKA